MNKLIVTKLFNMDCSGDGIYIVDFVRDRDNTYAVVVDKGRIETWNIDDIEVELT